MLQIRQLEKIIEGRSALAIDALDIEAGEVVAAIGPAGSGKTLLIYLLAGVLPPSRGSILFDGQPIAHAPKAAPGQMGVLFAEDLLYERQSARGNLDFYCRLHGLPATRSGEALAQVGLSDQAQKPCTKLTPAAQRRLAFARVLLRQPRLLLLDQPALRTDLPTQELLARLIREAAAGGATVLLTDEDLAWAGSCCSRVVELQAGRIANIYPFTRAAGGEGAAERFTPFRVPARKDDRIVLYDPGDIFYITSRDGHTYLRTAEEEAVTNFTLQELETRLSGRGFFKAHRAYLVNLQHIKAVAQYTRNSYNLLLDDKEETAIPLSKQSEKALQDLLGY